MATAAEITKTFAAAQISVETAQIARLAEQLRCAGADLERLIGGLAAEDVQPDLKVALRYKSALREEADPLLMAKRLRREAADLDHHVEASLREAADFYGMAAGRRLRGNDDSIAAAHDTRAKACEVYATDLSNTASEKRIQAAHIESAAKRRGEMGALIASVVRAA
jgi:hypothetical protein